MNYWNRLTSFENEYFECITYNNELLLKCILFNEIIIFCTFHKSLFWVWNEQSHLLSEDILYNN